MASRQSLSLTSLFFSADGFLLVLSNCNLITQWTLPFLERVLLQETKYFRKENHPHKTDHIMRFPILPWLCSHGILRFEEMVGAETVLTSSSLRARARLKAHCSHIWAHPVTPLSLHQLPACCAVPSPGYVATFSILQVFKYSFLFFDYSHVPNLFIAPFLHKNQHNCRKCI